MRWTSWLSHLRSHRHSVVGLDVGPHACSLVVLAGSAHEPDTVCCVERLDLPEAWVVQGEVVEPLALGQWLRHFLEVGDYQPQAIYMSIDDACVSNHLITLVAGLLPEDVAFQLHVEVQAMGGPHAAPVWVDHGIDDDVAPAGQQRYWVQAVAQARVEALQRLAQAARLQLMAIEPRAEAAQRAARGRGFLGTVPPASAALALQADEALGLALRAWNDSGCNFLPQRATAQHWLRRAWLQGVAVCAMGGVVLAAGFAMVMASAAASQSPRYEVIQASAQAFDQAQKSHAQAQAKVEHDTAQARWLAERQRLQLQTWQWGRVLGQDADGVWVVSVKQEGARWMMQGEALSSAHAQQLLQHLKVLDIWTQPPVMQQLRARPEPSAEGWWVWQFRMEANLKVGL